MLLVLAPFMVRKYISEYRECFDVFRKTFGLTDIDLSGAQEAKHQQL